MSAQGYFITGTDTEIGKTFTSCALLAGLRQQGFSAIGMKPIAAGTDIIHGERINEDVSQLKAASDPAAPELINPYLFDEPIAPHIAAEKACIEINLDHILHCYQQLAQQFEVVIVEGVGGFCVPLGKHQDTAHLAQALNLPVILVVGMRLGCINHALLTVEAIRARGLTLHGWIANTIDPAMRCFEENLEALRERIPAPLLAVLPHQSPPQPIRLQAPVPPAAPSNSPLAE